MLHDALLVGVKDLRIEARSKVALGQVVPFAAAAVLLFGLALGPDPSILHPAAAGLFWIAVLLSTVLATQRSFAVESRDGARDGLRLSGLDPAGIFLGKAAAVVVELLCLEAVLALGVTVLYGTRLTGGLVLVCACLAGTVGLSAVGTLYGALSSRLAVRETLLPLLFLPVSAPVLLGATKAWEAGLSGRASGGDGWLGLLVVFAVVYVSLGVLVFGTLLEQS